MKLLLMLCGLFISFASFTQEQLGLRLENYAGVSGLSLNPTSHLSNPLKWDLNLVGAGVFFENNYGYIQQTNTIDLIKNAGSAEFLFAGDTETQPGTKNYIFDFSHEKRNLYLATNFLVMGPSLAVKIGEQHSFGIFSNLRASAGSHDIPVEFNYYEYDTRAFFDSFKVKPFQGAFMSWSEIGLNYALKIPSATGYTGFGINLKYLTGYEGGYIENNQGWMHTKLPGDSISIGQPIGRFGFTNSNLTEDGFKQVANGRGLGVDLGFVTTFDEYEGSYKLKLGASLLDVGLITFNQNAQAHRINTDSNFIISLEDYKNFNSIEEFEDIVHFFSEQALGDSLASFAGNDFRMALPTAFSLQADYGFTGHIYLNATLVQRISVIERGPQRGNLFALTPRYEHRWFSASLPVSIYNWNQVRVGFAARLGYLVIGTENLGGLVGGGNFHGTDFYFALKVNPFELGLGIFGGSAGKRSFGGHGKVKCYDF